MASDTKVLLEDLVFPEGPRWHDGRLWFSDMHDQRVIAVDLDGRSETIAEVANQPSGLGWLPDGRLLVVSMTDRMLLRLDDDGLAEIADLSDLATCHCNDMVVDDQGRAYIGNFGFDLGSMTDPAALRTAELVLVTPEGRASVVADGLAFPNGTVITPDGSTLIVGETFGGCLTAFTIEPDGSLSNRRAWAAFDDRGFAIEPGRISPDGICLDADGGIWVTSPMTREVVRVVEGGEITDRIEVETIAFACMLGGEDGRTLFLCTAPTHEREPAREQRGGRIEMRTVEVPRAGRP